MIGFSLIFISVLVTVVARVVSPAVVCFLLICLSAPLYGSLGTDVPEVPNFISLLYKADKTRWTSFLPSVGKYDLLSYCSDCNLRDFLHWIPKAGKNSKRIFQCLRVGAEKLEAFAVEILGPTGVKFVPFLGTLFFYILIMNWMVLIPFMKAPSSSLNVTIALALCVFALVQYLNIKNWGLGGYLYHMAGFQSHGLSGCWFH